MQDVHTISEANVKVRTGTDKWKDLGTFDKGTKTFDVSEYDNIFAIRLEWAEGKSRLLYMKFIQTKMKNKIQMISESM